MNTLTVPCTNNIRKDNTSPILLKGGIKNIFGSTSSFQSVTTQTRSAGRLVNKDGSYSIEHVDHPNLLWKHWRNFFQILLEIKWRWVWLILCILFPLSWAAFALLFYAVARYHGDFEDDFKRNDTLFAPCVMNAKNYLSMFLYAVESQETIGYGYRSTIKLMKDIIFGFGFSKYTWLNVSVTSQGPKGGYVFRYDTEECPLLLFILCVQIVVGAVLQACLCAVIWARMLRPKRRGQEVIFSKNACVFLNEEKELCLAFRLSDIDGTHLVQSCIRLYVAIKKRIPNNNSFTFTLHHMHMGEETGRDKVLFIWPTLAYHVINKKSVLYTYDKEELANSDLEFILVAEGIVESTGLTVQTRTSYLSSEVLWGEKFQPMNFCEKSNQSKVIVKYNVFDKTFPVPDTPTCSAKELEERRGVFLQTNYRPKMSTVSSFCITKEEDIKHV